MNCVTLVGQRLMARNFDRQVAELHVSVAVLNRFTALGMPVRRQKHVRVVGQTRTTCRRPSVVSGWCSVHKDRQNHRRGDPLTYRSAHRSGNPAEGHILTFSGTPELLA